MDTVSYCVKNGDVCTFHIANVWCHYVITLLTRNSFMNTKGLVKLVRTNRSISIENTLKGPDFV